ncbi:MAG: beta-galactosidase [Lactovum sp.]
MKFNRILHGGDYNPEQFFNSVDYQSVIEKDIKALKKSEINFVTLAVFSWAYYNPAEDFYNFEYMDYLIKRLKEENFSIIMSTASGGFPNWLKLKYPSIHRTDSNNVQRTLGDRHNHCFHSPDSRREIIKINEKLAERYQNSKILLWHISNEMQGECYCQYCISAFQSWLIQRYQRIETLNQNWNMTFWSQTYNSFSEVFPPFDHGDGSNPCMRLAWSRFLTYSAGEMYQLEKETILKYIPNAKCTTNLCYGLGHNYNYGHFACLSDIVSWDSYHEWHKEEEYQTATEAILNFNLMRGFKQKNFFLMESTPNTANWREASKSKRPKLHETSSILALAYGAQSIGYFQMKRSPNHAEMFHSAVLDDFVYKNRLQKEIKSLGESLNSLNEILDSEVKNDIALIFDYEVRDIIKYNVGPRKGLGMPYCEYVEEIHHSFLKKGINIDLLSLNQDLTGYKSIVIPMHFMLSESQIDKLLVLARSGVRLYITSFTGLVDEENNLQLTGRHPKLGQLIGNHLLEYEALYPKDSARLLLYGSEVKTKIYHEYIEVFDDVEILASYDFDLYAKSPAITKYKNVQFFAALVDGHVISEQVMRDLELKTNDSRIICQTRSNQEWTYDFYFNFHPEEISFTSQGSLLATNKESSKKLLKQYEYAVYKSKNKENKEKK